MIKQRRKKLARLRAIRRIQRNKRLKVWIKPILVVGFITLILSSCLWVFHQIGDPMMNITFLNHTNAPVRVKIDPIRPDTHFWVRGGKDNTEGILDLTPPNREGSLYFGMGNWNPTAIQTTSLQIRQITINTEDKTIIYDTPDKIERLLNTGWKKTGSKNSIYIHIDTSP